MRKLYLGVVLLLMLMGAFSSPLYAQELVETNGRITQLEVRQAEADGEVLFQLDSEPGQTYAFELSCEPDTLHSAMFDLLRDAYANEWIVYIAHESGAVRRVRVQRGEEQARSLPSVIPEAESLQLVIPGDEYFVPAEVFPPNIPDATDIELVPWEEIPGSLTDELEAEILDAALANEEVVRALGDRYAFIAMDPYSLAIEGDKGVPDDVRPFLEGDSLVVRVVFFSHANNETVEVLMREREFLTLQTIPALVHQPPEGREEIEMAVRLAREALGDRVADLAGSGILAFPEGEESEEPRFLEHRILYVMFAERVGDTPRYYAYVDLTDAQVSSSGLIEEHSR